MAEKDLLRTLSEKRTIKDILVDKNVMSFGERIGKARKEVWVSGTSLTGTVIASRLEIEEILRKGQIKIKILLARESGTVVDQILDFYPTLYKREEITRRLKTTHDLLRR